jgi:hypothetical protein
MLRSLLINLVTADPEVQVVAESQTEAPPDFMLISDADPENELLPVATLMTFPRSRVLMFGPDGGGASLWELRPHRMSLGELSAQTIAECLTRLKR